MAQMTRIAATRVIKKQHSDKASISNDIPISKIENFVNCCEKLPNVLNDYLKETEFLKLIKFVEIDFVLKKLDNSNNSYPPISTLMPILYN